MISINIFESIFYIWRVKLPLLTQARLHTSLLHVGGAWQVGPGNWGPCYGEVGEHTWYNYGITMV